MSYNLVNMQRVKAASDSPPLGLPTVRIAGELRLILALTKHTYVCDMKCAELTINSSGLLLGTAVVGRYGIAEPQRYSFGPCLVYC